MISDSAVVLRSALAVVGVAWFVRMALRRGDWQRSSAARLRVRSLIVTFASGAVLWLALMFLPEWTWFVPGAGIATGLVMGFVASYRLASGERE